MGSPALFPLQCRAQESLPIYQHRTKIESGVPAGVEGEGVRASCSAGLAAHRKFEDLLKPGLEPCTVPNDRRVCRHHVLDLCPELVWALSGGAAQRRHRVSDRRIDDGLVDLGPTWGALCRSCGRLAGALAADQQVAERVATQAVCTVQPGGHLSRRVE